MSTFACCMERKIRDRFNKACVKYRLLEEGDRILIALSGGKDSLELVRLLGQRARIFKPHIEVEAAHVVMDNIPYETDRSYLEEFCKENGVRLHLLHSSFDESTDKRKTKCFLCAWNRRKALFEFARDNKFNKVALGHHQDDFLTTLLLNMTYEGRLDTMSPAMKMEHYPLTVIRPLCMVEEAQIKAFAEEENFHKQKVACPYEEKTNRTTMTQMLRHLEQLNTEARYSMWHAIEKNFEKRDE